MRDRYEKFRALAVTDPNILKGQTCTLYHTYCLGNASHVFSYEVQDFKVEIDDVINQPKFWYKYDNNMHQSFLNDCGMGESNHNQHLVFLDENTAQEYAKAYRKDPQECARYKQDMAELDELERALDHYDCYDYPDNYEDADHDCT